MIKKWIVKSEIYQGEKYNYFSAVIEALVDGEDAEFDTEIDCISEVSYSDLAVSNVDNMYYVYFSMFYHIQDTLNIVAAIKFQNHILKDASESIDDNYVNFDTEDQFAPVFGEVKLNYNDKNIEAVCLGTKGTKLVCMILQASEYSPIYSIFLISDNYFFRKQKDILPAIIKRVRKAYNLSSVNYCKLLGLK